MALKALMLRKQINDKQKSLEGLRAKADELKQREVELEKAIEESATEEERTAVEEEIEKYEAEKRDNDEAMAGLDSEIAELEKELDSEESEQEIEVEEPQEENRSEVKVMETRAKFFGMSAAEQTAFVSRDDVKNFLGEVRTAIAEKRAITNVGYLIPQVMLGLLRENVENYSKLYKHVYVRRISGTGRMIIEGQIPEAVWTEMCAKLNELDLSFDKIEIDGWKVGGFFRICNAILEDSDIDLAYELLSVLGQAIGFALDKAILYGTGTKMPIGVLTALEAVPGTPNIVSIAAASTGVDLFKEIILDAGKAKSKYSRGAKVWVMNETTYTKLIAESLVINAAGALVSGVGGTMPVVGGTIEVLNFIPDDVILGGYFDLYLLAERAGTELSTSEHAFWVEDQTGFKGTARYDGKVLTPDAFVALGINGVTPHASDVTFAEDTANNGI